MVAISCVVRADPEQGPQPLTSDNGSKGCAYNDTGVPEESRVLPEIPARKMVEKGWRTKVVNSRQ